MKKITAGIIAHVDAGKTTLSEALLYKTGALRQLGRVDNGDAFLDSDALEKARGITIFFARGGPSLPGPGANAAGHPGPRGFCQCH